LTELVKTKENSNKIFIETLAQSKELVDLFRVCQKGCYF